MNYASLERQLDAVYLDILRIQNFYLKGKINEDELMDNLDGVLEDLDHIKNTIFVSDTYLEKEAKHVR